MESGRLEKTSKTIQTNHPPTSNISPLNRVPQYCIETFPEQLQGWNSSFFWRLSPSNLCFCYIFPCCFWNLKKLAVLYLLVAHEKNCILFIYDILITIFLNHVDKASSFGAVHLKHSSPVIGEQGFFDRKVRSSYLKWIQIDSSEVMFCSPVVAVLSCTFIFTLHSAGARKLKWCRLFHK